MFFLYFTSQVLHAFKYKNTSMSRRSSVIFMVYCACEFRLMITGTKIMKVLMDITNIALMVIGAVGINYAQYCNSSAGNLVCYREL